MEVFKAVKGYQGYYEISNLGRVRSVGRTIKKIYGYWYIKERILKQNTGKYGFKYVVLSKNNLKKKYSIHTLIAESFFGSAGVGGSAGRTEMAEVGQSKKIYNGKPMSSKYKGVSRHTTSKKWCAYIRINGKLKYLGSFNDEKSAYKKYQNELKAYKIKKSIQKES